MVAAVLSPPGATTVNNPAAASSVSLSSSSTQRSTPPVSAATATSVATMLSSTRSPTSPSTRSHHHAEIGTPDPAVRAPTFKRIASTLEQSIRGATRSSKAKFALVPHYGDPGFSNDSTTLTTSSTASVASKGKERAITPDPHRVVHKERSKVFTTRGVFRRNGAVSPTSPSHPPPSSSSSRLVGQDDSKADGEHPARRAGFTSFITPSLRGASMSSPSLLPTAHQAFAAVGAEVSSSSSGSGSSSSKDKREKNKDREATLTSSSTATTATATTMTTAGKHKRASLQPAPVSKPMPLQPREGRSSLDTVPGQHHAHAPPSSSSSSHHRHDHNHHAPSRSTAHAAAASNNTTNKAEREKDINVNNVNHANANNTTNATKSSSSSMSQNQQQQKQAQTRSFSNSTSSTATATVSRTAVNTRSITATTTSSTATVTPANIPAASASVTSLLAYSTPPESPVINYAPLSSAAVNANANTTTTSSSSSSRAGLGSLPPLSSSTTRRSGLSSGLGSSSTSHLPLDHHGHHQQQQQQRSTSPSPSPSSPSPLRSRSQLGTRRISGGGGGHGGALASPTSPTSPTATSAASVSGTSSISPRRASMESGSRRPSVVDSNGNPRRISVDPPPPRRAGEAGGVRSGATTPTLRDGYNNHHGSSHRTNSATTTTTTTSPSSFTKHVNVSTSSLIQGSAAGSGSVSSRAAGRASPLPSSPSSPSPYSRHHHHQHHHRHSHDNSAGRGSNPEHRDLIRQAARVLCTHLAHARPPASHFTRSEWDQVEVRMQALARAERVWSKSSSSGAGAGAGGAGSGFVGSNGSASGSQVNLSLAAGGGSSGSEERERRYFGEAVRDGYVLCQFMNKIQPNAITRPNPKDDPAAHASNIHKFLAAAALYGVLPAERCSKDDILPPSSSPDSVSSSLILPSQESLARVAKTILALERLHEELAPTPSLSSLVRSNNSKASVASVTQHQQQQQQASRKRRTTPVPAQIVTSGLGGYIANSRAAASTPNLGSGVGGAVQRSVSPVSPSVGGVGGSSSSSSRTAKHRSTSSKRWSPPTPALTTVSSGSGSGSGSSDGEKSRSRSRNGAVGVGKDDRREEDGEDEDDNEVAVADDDEEGEEQDHDRTLRSPRRSSASRDSDDAASSRPLSPAHLTRSPTRLSSSATRQRRESEDDDLFTPYKGHRPHHQHHAHNITRSSGSGNGNGSSSSPATSPLDVRQSLSSSIMSDSTTYSLFLDSRQNNASGGGANRYGTVRTMTTDTTSILDESGNNCGGSSPVEESALSSSATTSGGVFIRDGHQHHGRRMRERKMSEQAPLDLSRVAEESASGGEELRDPDIVALERKHRIRLGKGVWPDDFMDAFPGNNGSAVQDISSAGGTPLSSSPPIPIIRRSSDARANAIAGETMWPSTPSPVGTPTRSTPPRKLAIVERTGQDSVDALPNLPRRPTHRSRHSIDGAGTTTSSGLAPKESILRRDVSPQSRLMLRRNSSRGPHRNAMILDGVSVGGIVPLSASPPKHIPFPRTPENEDGPPSPDGSGIMPSAIIPERPKLRGRFQSDIDGAPGRKRPTSYEEVDSRQRRSRIESMVNLGGGGVRSSNASASDLLSSRDSMDGSVRQTLIVKEDGKTPTSFAIGNCVGRGQFGSVYRALNINTGQMVAVKRIGLEGLKEEEVTQLMHEVDLLKSLSHPSIVKYEGMARDANTLSIVLEYVENGSLGQTLKAFGKLNERLVASYVLKILEGLDYLHQNDVVHCDLKSANILTTKNGNVKLSDFGVSLNLRAMERQEHNNVAGTPNWMAPEVIELKGASTKSDIWSLACTIVELLTGRPPYGDIANTMTVMFRVVEDDMPPIPEECSEALHDFLKQCFNKDPAKRPSAEQLAEHDWLKQSFGLDKDLRQQDSIPFLRRVSTDLHKAGQAARINSLGDLVQEIAQPSTPIKAPLEDTNGPHNPLNRQLSSGAVSDPADIISPRDHDFLKTTLSQAVTCRVCLLAVKKNAVICKECSLLAHSKCAQHAPPTCGLRSQLLMYAQYAEKGQPPNPYLNWETLGSIYPTSPTSEGSQSVSLATPRTSIDGVRPVVSPSGDSSNVHPPTAFKLGHVLKRAKSPTGPSEPVRVLSPDASEVKERKPTRKPSILRRSRDPPAVSLSSNRSSLRSAVTESSHERRQSGITEADSEVGISAPRSSRMTSTTTDSDVAVFVSTSSSIEEERRRNRHKRRGEQDSKSNNNCIVQ